MLEKNWEPAKAEGLLYQGWEESGAFAAHPAGSAAPFSIMIPPPNVTGSLHVGHALTMTLQDILTRYRRMQGRDALWQPGTDHAGIATQLIVERQLAETGIQRKQIGREAFLRHVWDWKAKSGGTITSQLRRLGASPDWERERFTMDEGLSRAVREVFVSLHREGLIYRDNRLVNWDPLFASAISDLEVEGRELNGHLWHLRYPTEDGGQIIVATTRPETMLGDTAIAVHPDDERYRDMVGKFVILPLTGRRIPIIADEYSDPAKGSGAVKITPAHDFNDFAVGQRNHLPMISVLDRAARISLAELGDAPSAFVQSLAGLDRFEARALIISELERLDLLEKIEPHRHLVPHGERSGVPIEPFLTVQWYCNAEILAGPAVAAVESGRVAFVPKQWENNFYAWMRDIQPWCISRQLWWGHRIPAWYGPDGAVFVDHDEAGAAAQARAHYGHEAVLTQDEDVLDTWFSSALWPFSTLGWPDKTAELARYYPTDVLITGFDIIFFWVARMMMMGLHFMGDVPFRQVYINGLVRDERNQKMSKSKGNVVDPLDLIEKYGTDAVRFTAAIQSGSGRSPKMGPNLVENSRSFVTKLWNAARFAEMNNALPVPGFLPQSVQLSLSRWILNTANQAIRDAGAALDALRFNDYADICYRFAWGDFCDWFLELSKPGFASNVPGEAEELRAVTAHVLGILLRLMHPLMPYVTEKLWDHFGFGAPCSLIKAAWPEPVMIPNAAQAEVEISWLIRLISEIRTVRSEMNVPPSQRAPLMLRDASSLTIERAMRWSEVIGRMARASSVEPMHGDIPHGAAQIILDETTIVLPLANLIDLDAERKRLARERGKAAEEAEKLTRKLANEEFVARAPEDIITENRDRLIAAEADMARLDAALRRIA